MKFGFDIGIYTFFQAVVQCQWEAGIRHLPHIARLGLLHRNHTAVAFTHQFRSQPAKRSKHIVFCDDVILL